MAAGAWEQTASCDAFVLSRRLPAPGAPPCRRSPACLIARTRPSSYLLSQERYLPRIVPAASAAPGVSLFRHFRSYLTLPPTMHGLLRHPPLPGVSLFRRFRSYLTLPPILHGPLRHPPLPGVSRFPRSCCYLHAPSPERPSVEHPPVRGTSRCAPGAFSLTAPVF